MSVNVRERMDIGKRIGDVFFNVHPDLWGFMIQFEEHIFQLGWLKPTRKPKYVSRSIFLSPECTPAKFNPWKVT